MDERMKKWQGLEATGGFKALVQGDGVRRA